MPVEAPRAGNIFYNMYSGAVTTAVVIGIHVEEGGPGWEMLIQVVGCFFLPVQETSAEGLLGSSNSWEYTSFYYIFFSWIRGFPIPIVV